MRAIRWSMRKSPPAMLTAEQAARAKAREGSFLNPGIGGRGGHGHDGGVIDDLHATAATALGITPETLMQEMRAGKTLAQVASDHGVSRDSLKATLTSAAQTAIQKALTAGQITQAQADELKSGLGARIDQMLDATGKGPMGSRGHGARPHAAPAQQSAQ